MSEPKPITLREAVEQVVAQLDGPIALDEVVHRVLAIKPSKAKNPEAAVRNHLRWEEAGKTLALLDRQTVAPLRVAMQGVRFRIPIDPEEARRGVLCIDPAFRYFLRWGIAYEDVRLLDAMGQPLPVRVVKLKQEVQSIFGPSTREVTAFDLGEWFRAN